MWAVVLTFILLGVIVLAAIGFIIYFFIYKSRINKTLRDNDGTSKKAMPSPGKTLTSVAVCIVAVAGIINSVSLVVINMTLKEEEKRLENEIGNLSKYVDNLENKVSDLTDCVENAYDFFYSVELSPAEFDAEAKSFKIEVTVEPKITSVTAIRAGFDGGFADFSKNQDGTYTGTVNYQYAEETDEQTLCFTLESGETEFQERVTVTDGDVTSMFFISVSDSSSFVLTSHNGELKTIGSAVYSIQIADGNTLSASLHVSVNGKDEYADELIDDVGTGNGKRFGFYDYTDITVPGSSEDQIEVYLRFERNDGYVFEVPCTYMVYEDDGLSCSGSIYSGNVTDKNGNLKSFGNSDDQAVKRIYLPNGERLK